MIDGGPLAKSSDPYEIIALITSEKNPGSKVHTLLWDDANTWRYWILLPAFVQR